MEEYSADKATFIFRDLGLDETRREQLVDKIAICAETWSTEVGKLLRLSGEQGGAAPFPSSLAREGAYWRELLTKATASAQVLESRVALLCRLLLTHYGKISARDSLDACSRSLAEVTEVATDSMDFVRLFPMDEVLLATDLARLRSGVGQCLQHFSRLSTIKYPYTRAMLCYGFSRPKSPPLLSL